MVHMTNAFNLSTHSLFSKTMNVPLSPKRIVALVRPHVYGPVLLGLLLILAFPSQKLTV